MATLLAKNAEVLVTTDGQRRELKSAGDRNPQPLRYLDGRRLIESNLNESAGRLSRHCSPTTLDLRIPPPNADLRLIASSRFSP